MSTPAVAERAALAVRLGDRRVERDYSLKSRRNLDQRHGRRILSGLVVRIATHEDDAADVARLMIGFRNWQGRSERGRRRSRPTVRRLLADPSTEFLLGGSPRPASASSATGSSVWTGTEDCCLEDLFVEADVRGSGLGRALVEAALERARERGCARIGLDANEANRPALALYRSVGFDSWSAAAGGQRPLYAAASLTSSTSSPTAMRPGCTMSARRPARCTIPLRTPG